MKIVAKLTDTQKTVIKRDFISHFLCENGHGDNNASKLLRDFANMHFPDQYGLVKATHEEEYQKRHERLEERIKEMKKAEKKAAREAEKQQTTEKTGRRPPPRKQRSPKAEKPPDTKRKACAGNNIRHIFHRPKRTEGRAGRPHPHRHRKTFLKYLRMKYIRMFPDVEYSTDRDFFLENQIVCIVSRGGHEVLQPDRKPSVHAFPKPPYQQADAAAYHV